MKVIINKPVVVELGLIKIHAKCTDCFSMTVLDTNGNEILDHDGYVASFMPGNHYGDYIILDIDPKTGVITNWPKIEDIAAGVQEYIDEKGND